MKSPEQMYEVSSLLEHCGSSDWCSKLLFAEMRNDEELKDLLRCLKTFSGQTYCIS